MMMMVIFVLAYIAQAVAKPIFEASQTAYTNDSGLEVVDLAISIKMAETTLAIISVTLVIITYSVLIKKVSFLPTAAMYPQHSIEGDISSLLSLAWPRRSHEAPGTESNLRRDSKIFSRLGRPSQIQLFYLGRMNTDNHSGLVAKGRLDCVAKPRRKASTSYRPRLWLNSGSHLTKDVVQLLVWEWVSLWLMTVMLFVTLLHNGFPTNQISADSYPRLVIILIYVLSYFFHFSYVWTICMRFFTNFAAGAAWSFLERAKFAICDSKMLQRHEKGSTFRFRGIDRANSEYVPLTFDAVFKHEVNLRRGLIDHIPPSSPVVDPEANDPREVRAALAAFERSQKVEREMATESARAALDRVIANAMIMMGVTLASGFSSWTARQVTDNTPNKFAAAQIGSLALFASLSLGAFAMFTSAMRLATLSSACEAELSLKEAKINGQAVEHYKRRPSSDTVLSFTRGTVPISHVSFCEILSMNNSHSFLSTLLLGPAFALMPSRGDYKRTSKVPDIDLNVRVRSGIGEDVEGSRILFTTRETDRHGRGKDGKNLEAINVCCIEDNEAGSGDEKVSWIDHRAL